MTRARRYALTSSGAAVAAAVIGLPWIPERWDQGVIWAVYGWALAAIVGIVTGTWLARAHGRPGPGVLAALVTGILARMVLVAAGLFVAVRDGRGSAWGFLSGFALAFVPLLTHEVVWSIRANRNRT